MCASGASLERTELALAAACGMEVPDGCTRSVFLVDACRSPALGSLQHGGGMLHGLLRGGDMQRFRGLHELVSVPDDDVAVRNLVGRASPLLTPRLRYTAFAPDDLTELQMRMPLSWSPLSSYPSAKAWEE